MNSDAFQEVGFNFSTHSEIPQNVVADSTRPGTEVLS
jgi:hypothetical protein